MIRIGLTIIVFSSLLGCSSKVKNNNDQLRSDLSKPYTVDVVAQPQIDDKNTLSGSCPSKLKDIDGVDWTKLLGFANACIRRGNWNMVEAIGNKLAVDTSHSPWGPYYLSLVAERHGNMPKALWMIDLAIKRSPNVGILTYNKARLLWKMDLFEESVSYFEKSILLKVNVLEAHYFLGKIYLRDQDLNSAKSQFEISLKYNPQHFDSLLEIAKIYSLKGDVGNEMIFLERARKVKPSDKWIKQRLSLLISQNSPRDPASEEANSSQGGKQ